MYHVPYKYRKKKYYDNQKIKMNVKPEIKLYIYSDCNRIVIATYDHYDNHLFAIKDF